MGVGNEHFQPDRLKMKTLFEIGLSARHSAAYGKRFLLQPHNIRPPNASKSHVEGSGTADA